MRGFLSAFERAAVDRLQLHVRKFPSQLSRLHLAFLVQMNSSRPAREPIADRIDLRVANQQNTRAHRLIARLFRDAHRNRFFNRGRRSFSRFRCAAAQLGHIRLQLKCAMDGRVAAQNAIARVSSQCQPFPF